STISRLQNSRTALRLQYFARLPDCTRSWRARYSTRCCRRRGGRGGQPERSPRYCSSSCCMCDPPRRGHRRSRLPGSPSACRAHLGCHPGPARGCHFRLGRSASQYSGALIGFRGLMLQHGPRSTPPYLRPLKKKGFKEKRATTIGLYDSGKSTTLESNKSQQRLEANLCEFCGKSGGYFEVHHIRKLKDVKGKEAWERIMIARRRKTRVAANECHDFLHAGKLSQ